MLSTSTSSSTTTLSDRAAVHDLLTTFTSYYASGAYQDHLEWEFRFSSFRTFNAKFNYDFLLLYDEYASVGSYLQAFGWKLQGPPSKFRRFSVSTPLLSSSETAASNATRTRITEHLDGRMIGKMVVEHKTPYLISKTKSMQELSELYHVRVSMQQEKVESGLTQQDIRSKRDAYTAVRDITRTCFVHPDFPSMRIDCSDVTTHQQKDGSRHRAFEIELEILPQSVRALSAAKIIEAIRQIIMGIQFAPFGIMSGRKWRKVAGGLNDVLGYSQMRFPQPVSISPNHLQAIVQGEFAVTEKADGRRSLLYLSCAEENKRELFRVDFYGRLISTGLQLSTDLHPSISSFLLDSEYIEDQQLFLVFDIYMFEGVVDWQNAPAPQLQRIRFHSVPLPDRYRSLQAILSKCVSRWTGKGASTVRIQLKNMVFPSGNQASDNRALFEFIHGVTSKKLVFPYKIEGLLFTHLRSPLPVQQVGEGGSSSFVLPVGSTLSACRWSGAVKFKEPSDTTNDFQLGRFQLDDVKHTLFAPLFAYSSSLSQLVMFAGVLPHDPLGEKHSFLRLEDQRSVSRRDVMSTSFVVELGALQLYEGCIVECSFDKERKRWVPLRSRPDKRFPNSVDVVYANWELIHSPIVLPTCVEDAEKLLSASSDETLPPPDQTAAGLDYYQQSGSQDRCTAAMREFHNSVKRLALKTVIRNYSSTAAAGQKLQLLDLAIGRGGDLHKYFAESKQIGKIIGVDVNAANLELCQRRYLQMCVSADQTDHPRLELLNGSSAWSFQDAQRWVQFEKQLPQRHSCDVATLHFALHYFWQTAGELEGLLSNLDFSIPVGGFFLATCFDGLRVYDFFQRNDALTLQDRKTGQTYLQIRPGKDWRKWNEEDAFGMELLVYSRSIHESQTFAEWLVHPDRLRRDMARIGFRLIRLSDLFGHPLHGLDESFLDMYVKQKSKRLIPEEQLSTIEAWNRLFVFERVSYHPIGMDGDASTSISASTSSNTLHRYVNITKDGDRKLKFANSVHLHPSTYYGLTVPLQEVKQQLMFGK